MTVLDVFLKEAFPPKKPATGGSKSPTGGKPGGGKPFGGDDAGGPSGPGAGMGAGLGGDNSDALIAAQEAEEEQERQEAESRAASAAADQQERDRVKELRAAADEEVAADLSSKYSDQPDQVIWHPDVDGILYGGMDDGKDTAGEAKGTDKEDKDGFAGHMDKKMGLKNGDDSDSDTDLGKDDDKSADKAEGDEDETNKNQSDNQKAKKQVVDDGDPERLSKKKPKQKQSTAGPANAKIIIKSPAG
jgi:hypothetical protein